MDDINLHLHLYNILIHIYIYIYICVYVCPPKNINRIDFIFKSDIIKYKLNYELGRPT